MTMQELIIRLKNVGIPDDSYSLTGGMPNDRYCIEEVFGKWQVYYSERGKKYQEKYFTSEEEACEFLYSILANMFK